MSLVCPLFLRKSQPDILINCVLIKKKRVNSEKKGRYLSKNKSVSEPTKTNFHMKQISGWSVPSNVLKIQ